MGASPANSPGPSPYLGIEIEIFVRVKTFVQTQVLSKRRRRELQPRHWEQWDFELDNNRGSEAEKGRQRGLVCQAIKEVIDKALSPRHGRRCKTDASLKEWLLAELVEPRKRCKCGLFPARDRFASSLTCEIAQGVLTLSLRLFWRPGTGKGTYSESSRPLAGDYIYGPMNAAGATSMSPRAGKGKHVFGGRARQDHKSRLFLRSAQGTAATGTEKEQICSAKPRGFRWKRVPQGLI